MPAFKNSGTGDAPSVVRGVGPRWEASPTRTPAKPICQRIGVDKTPKSRATVKETRKNTHLWRVPERTRHELDRPCAANARTTKDTTREQRDRTLGNISVVLPRKGARKFSPKIASEEPSRSAILDVVPSWLVVVLTTAWNKEKRTTFAGRKASYPETKRQQCVKQNQRNM